MTVANMGATAVLRLRGLQVWRGFGRPLAAARPPARGARSAKGRGQTGETPQTRKEHALRERLCPSGQRHTSQIRRLFPQTPGEGPRQKSCGFSRRSRRIWQKQECGFQQRLTPV